MRNISEGEKTFVRLRRLVSDDTQLHDRSELFEERTQGFLIEVFWNLSTMSEGRGGGEGRGGVLGQ